MPLPSVIPFMLNHMVAGIEDLTDGTGIHAYWVFDEENAGPHEVFHNQNDRTTWAADHRNTNLSEFVHLMYADSDTEFVSGGYASPAFGAYVLVETKWDESIAMGFDFYFGLERTAAHEITHLLIDAVNEENPPGTPVFDVNEHLIVVDDKLMALLNPLNYTDIVFSDHTRIFMDLTTKESVDN